MQKKSEGTPGKRKQPRRDRMETYGFRRSTVERVRLIELAITRQQYPNRPALAAELEVSETTIKRDIQFMRQRLKQNIGFDFAKNGYFYRKSPVVSAFGGPTLNSQQATFDLFGNDLSVLPGAA